MSKAKNISEMQVGESNHQRVSNCQIVCANGNGIVARYSHKPANELGDLVAYYIKTRIITILHYEAVGRKEYFINDQ